LQARRHPRRHQLDRLARSLPDARDILDELTETSVKLSLGGSTHDPTNPVGRLLFNVLAMVDGTVR
jgi:DNA invertase Pin-like site-specific DNA recombinase